MNKQRGITLIALVVTIIVLIILAGVSINLVLGDNGIIEKVKEAKENTELAKVEEEVQLNEAVEYLENLGESKIKPVVDVSTIEAGIFIKYDVEYTDTYHADYKYEAINGWRLMDYKTRDDGKTLYDVKLISTGIPARMYYFCSDRTNNYSRWVTDSTKLNQFKEILGSDYNCGTSSEPDGSLQAAAGFYYNLGQMTFIQGTDYSSMRNMGYYTLIKNGDKEYTTGEKYGNDLFKARSDASIRIPTLSEINTILERTDINSKDQIYDSNGLYKLGVLKNVLIGKNYTSGKYWLASPSPYKNCNEYIYAVGYNGGISGYMGNYEGIRPVICISSDIKLSQEIDENGFKYYSIVD